MIRANNDSLNKKLINAWIFCPRKTGRPQNSSNNNFMSVIPDFSKNGKFTEWALHAQDKTSWNAKIVHDFAEYTTPKSEEDLN